MNKYYIRCFFWFDIRIIFQTFYATKTFLSTILKLFFLNYDKLCRTCKIVYIYTSSFISSIHLNVIILYEIYFSHFSMLF